ncbi:hypothetical protein [Nonomuraea sp. NPDC050786]|uniref:hypothetical protein n=1 Tax=Nonomuraea sp. NPDC050786 TaxID=3154840 RepID=UPI0033D0ECD6
MALLSKDAIFTAQDLKTMDVSVPEWGGEVRVRTLTGRERDDFESESVTIKGNKREMKTNLRARLVVKCAVDESGAPLFTPADVMKLGQKSAPALERVFEAAAKLNGMTDEDVADLEGNSDAVQSDGSTSD